MFVKRHSRIWDWNDRLGLNCEGPSIPSLGLYTILGGNREPLRVLKQGSNFIKVAPLNINLMLCAGQIEGGELEYSWKIPGRGGESLNSDQRNKQCPRIYPNRILIHVESSLSTPPVCEAGTSSGIYLTSNPFPLPTQWQAHNGTENNHRLDFIEREENVCKMEKRGDRADTLNFLG